MNDNNNNTHCPWCNRFMELRASGNYYGPWRPFVRCMKDDHEYYKSPTSEKLAVNGTLYIGKEEIEKICKLKAFA